MQNYPLRGAVLFRITSETGSMISVSTGRPSLSSRSFSTASPARSAPVSPHRGQRRAEHFAYRRIVKSRNGNILRHADALLGEKADQLNG